MHSSRGVIQKKTETDCARTGPAHVIYNRKRQQAFGKASSQCQLCEAAAAKLLDRLTQSSADFYRDSSSIFFIRQLLSELAERNSTKTAATCSEVSVIWKRMSEIWGIP